jgi:molybdopterin molybdotransferase
MDGYAVHSAEVRTASAGSPVTLRLAGAVSAGEVFEGELAPGHCLRITTGARLPQGADAVVMQEDTQHEAASPEEVKFLDGAKPFENVRVQGEDVRAGRQVLRPGDLLSAGRLGLLAALGLSRVLVRRQPIVGLLATGNELLEPGTPLRPGAIFESNRATLAPLVEQSGGAPRIKPIVIDDPEATRSALHRALEECDMVVSTGGVSVGEKDFVKPAFAALGGTLDFWRVAIKPGKPFVFGRAGSKKFFGLPGNPLSAVVTFLLLVRPALWKAQGATDVLPATRLCTLIETVVNEGDRRHFLRVHVDVTGRARLAGGQASHLLSTLSQANGLLDMAPRSTLAADSTVPVICFG